MIEYLSCDAAPGLSVYYAVTDSSVHYFDFADNTFKALVHKAINAVTTGGTNAGAFRVAGDVTASLTVGKKIRVRGSTGNDNVYTIRSGSAFAGGNTTINVAEAVGNGTADGTVDLNATPYATATENANGGGSGVSRYTASVDLNLVNPTTTVGQYAFQAFQRAGSAPVPDSDTAVSGSGSLTVQLGLEGIQEVRPRFVVNVTSTLGNVAQLAAWLEVNGQVAPLHTIDPAATCAAAIVQFGELAAFTAATSDFGAVTSAHRFEFTKNNPGFTGDQQYRASVTIIANGNTFTCDEPFPVFA